MHVSFLQIQGCRIFKLSKFLKFLIFKLIA